MRILRIGTRRILPVLVSLSPGSLARERLVPETIAFVRTSAPPQRVALVGDYAVSAGHLSGRDEIPDLEVVDLSNPAVPVLVAVFPLPGDAEDLAL